MPNQSNRIYTFLVGIFILLYPRVSSAQQVYGFEWIRPYQPYVKIKLIQEGVYRIQASELAGFSSYNPRKFQLFKNGKEQAIYVSGELDGVFDPGDFIEFFGSPNDGMLDREMYRTPADQAQTFKSIFSDTAYYFLSVLPDSSSHNPIRFQTYSDADYANYTAEPNLEIVQQLVPQEDYYYGAFIPADQKYYLSEYAASEGMMSALIGQSQAKVYTFQTPNKSNNLNAFVEIKLIGASDFFLPNPNSPNHHVRISILPDGLNASILIDTTFRGYGEQKFVRTISANLLGETTQFRVEVINDIAVGSDFVGVSYIQLRYPRTISSLENAVVFELPKTQLGSKTLFQLNNYTGVSPVLYDLSQGIRVIANKNVNQIQALIPFNASKSKLVLHDLSNVLTPISVMPHQFVVPNVLANYQYLIVSNKQLKMGAEAYQTYRNIKYNTYLAYAEDLSDYYTYGHFHPLAIRKFCKHLFDKQNTAPQFLLLLGRGYQNNLLKLNRETNQLNLVPAFGVPSSDHMFTNDFVGLNGAPSIATGRIPASNLQELNNYLQKLKALEINADSINAWRKDFLHLSGGSYESQQNEFKNQLAAMGNMVLGKPIGARIFPYFKKSSAPTDGDLKSILLKHLNNGVNMMTFYGHGSLTVLDMDFGGINDLQANNKPAFYYFNGCNIGNANDVDPLGTGLVYGKDYICAANKGAIGWLAHTNLTFTNQLSFQMNQLYQQLGLLNYSLPIGLQVKRALEVTSQSNEQFARSHALQLLLQGDPAFVLYAPAKPDYQIENSDLFVTPSNASVQNDSLAIGIIIHNLAKAVTDTLHIQLQRKLPNNSVQTFDLNQAIAPLNVDTFFVWVKPLLKQDIGDNVFTVKINPTQKVQEIKYTNNEASINYFLPGSGLQTIYPKPYAIINTDSVELLVQNNNLFTEPATYIFEIDTTPSFNSNSIFNQKSAPITATHLAKWKISLSSQDSLVYFWRAKINLPENQGGIWVQQSFTFMKNASKGWHQQRYEQLKNASAKTFIQFEDTTRRLVFSNNSLVLGIENRRWDHRRMGVVIPYLLNAGVGSCISQGTVVLVFEPYQVDFPYELPNYPFNCAFVQANKFDQSVRYYTFNTNFAQGQQDLAQFIDSIPNGYYVAMFSRYSSGIESWPTSVKSQFAKIGSVKVPQITNHHTAWAIIGMKGEAPGLAIEDTVTNNDLKNTPNLPPGPTDPQDEMYLRIRREISLKWYTGNFTSMPIGPASSYKQLNLLLEEKDPLPKGRWWLDVIGINTSGKDTFIYRNQTQTQIDLSSIDAQKYPYIKLQLGFVDSTYRTPHQVKYWQVLYEGGPELSIDVNAQYKFYASVIEKGDSLRLDLPIVNLGESIADSIETLFEILDESRKIPYSYWLKVPPISANESTLVRTQIPTQLLSGKNTLQVNINATKKVKELNYLNNFLKQDFTVKGDLENPYLQVTFDGQRIFNRDIVSPNPTIRISSTDNNSYLMQKDTNTFEFYIRKPGSFEFDRVFLNNPDVIFSPATDKNEAFVLFNPKNLKDGVYALKVQATDASGNKAGAREYEIEFTVINKSTITHFYPYPNPFTTQMRFVFTLTGSKVPDQLLIRILTLNGKVVKEVRTEEFGNIRIGNNISEFAWDGTDQFGDKLANGVYLYQVYTKINGDNIEQAKTKARDESSFFVNGTGKIYLMR